MQRRDFLKFMGRGTLVSSILTNSLFEKTLAAVGAELPTLPHLKAGTQDTVIVADGLKSDILIKWQDPINAQGELFGMHCDFLAFLPGKNANEASLWSNHEYIHPLLASGFSPEANIGVRKTKAQADIERKQVGGSYLKIKKQDGQWVVDTKTSDSFRVDGTTPMEIISDRELVGSKTAIGMTGNCSGGKTPWGTILTCEENFQDFYGQVTFSKREGKQKRHVIAASSAMAWDDHYPHPPEHYGWVVEVDPTTKTAKKLTALGRFAHEGAFLVQAKDGRPVVYMGDDTQSEHFYKFIAEKPGSLEKGNLYVANTVTGRWEHLSIKNPKLKNHFQDQTELLIRTREAAKLLGATPLDRPEACAQDPIGKGIYLACTMNKDAGRPYGSLLRLVEKDKNPLSRTFKADIFLNGGELTGFACPDNVAFDKKGNLWMTTDVADYDLNSPAYKAFGNNSLFYIPLRGPQAGKPHRFAIAPMEAEFTGPCFSEDGKTLFLSVQHPGANTKDLKNPTSRWPEGKKDSLPRSSVIALSGPLLDSLIKIN